MYAGPYSSFVCVYVCICVFSIIYGFMSWLFLMFLGYGQLLVLDESLSVQLVSSWYQWIYTVLCIALSENKYDTIRMNPVLFLRVRALGFRSKRRKTCHEFAEFAEFAMARCNTARCNSLQRFVCACVIMTFPPKVEEHWGMLRYVRLCVCLSHASGSAKMHFRVMITTEQINPSWRKRTRPVVSLCISRVACCWWDNSAATGTMECVRRMRAPWKPILLDTYLCLCLCGASRGDSNAAFRLRAGCTAGGGGEFWYLRFPCFFLSVAC